MPPAKPAVWKHFKRSADDKTVKCNLCITELAFNNSTSCMLNHLRLRHGESTVHQGPSKDRQSSMTSFIATKKLPATQKEKITQAIADMVVSDYLPLSLVEGEGFRNLMQIVAPDYEVPCRNSIRARIVKKYDEKKTTLQESLQNVSSASLTTDTWTSTSTDSYITVTEHHITEDWTLDSNVLLTRAMPERHTGINIAAKLQDCVTEFGLNNKVETCVHDNARNMECAGDLCPEWSDYGCFAHTLQLCIKPCLEVPQVEKTVSKCRKLVGHFKHSTTLTAEIRSRQTMFNVPHHELIQDVCTRWNSTQMMLERLCEQRRVVTDIVLDTKVSKKTDSCLLPTEREWEVMTEVSTVLRDLTKVTEFISLEKDVFSSYVFPIVCGLVRKLKVQSEDSNVVRKVKDTVSQELQKRFQPFSTESATTVLGVASLLDPRYKRLPFFSEDQRKAAEGALGARLEDIPLRLRSRDTSEPPPARLPSLMPC